MDKIVCISGVSRGLGRAMSKEFDKRGWQVAGCARSKVAIEELNSQLSNPCFLDTVDIVKSEETQSFAQKTIQRLGCPTLLLNNAGIINKNAPLHEISQDEFLEVFKVNLSGTQNLISAFLPAMKRKEAGIIVNFSSYWGQSTAPEVGPYCASKWAVEGLTRSLSQELPPGLATIAFNPGIIDTDMLRSCFGTNAGNYEKPKDWAKHAVDRLESLTEKDNGKTIVG